MVFPRWDSPDDYSPDDIPQMIFSRWLFARWLFSRWHSLCLSNYNTPLNSNNSHLLLTPINNAQLHFSPYFSSTILFFHHSFSPSEVESSTLSQPIQLSHLTGKEQQSPISHTKLLYYSPTSFYSFLTTLFPPVRWSTNFFSTLSQPLKLSHLTGKEQHTYIHHTKPCHSSLTSFYSFPTTLFLPVRLRALLFSTHPIITPHKKRTATTYPIYQTTLLQPNFIFFFFYHTIILLPSSSTK